LLSIFNGGIGLIFAKTIASMTYLGSGALVMFNIVYVLLLDSCPFLLEVIGANNSSSFHFQTHLRSSQEFLPLIATCLPPF
jgi:hypothetical protein